MQVTIFSAPGRQGQEMRNMAVNALHELGMDGQVRLTSEAIDCVCAGVMITPAVSINGQVVAQGWQPDQLDLKYKIEDCLRG